MWFHPGFGDLVSGFVRARDARVIHEYIDLTECPLHIAEYRLHLGFPAEIQMPELRSSASFRYFVNRATSHAVENVCERNSCSFASEEITSRASDALRASSYDCRFSSYPAHVLPSTQATIRSAHSVATLPRPLSHWDDSFAEVFAC